MLEVSYGDDATTHGTARRPRLATSDFVAERPANGNLVLVTHQVNITALTGIVPAPGEFVVLTPGGDGTFTVRGRVPAAPATR